MTAGSLSTGVVRFGVYEVDLRAGELRKQGFKVKLQEKPFQILAALLEHPGELVTREELCKQLWPSDTFVDFDSSLNAATNKLREALDDSAGNPRFVETLPRRGYRFIASVEKSAVASAAGAGSTAPHESSPGPIAATAAEVSPLTGVEPPSGGAASLAVPRSAWRRPGPLVGVAVTAAITAFLLLQALGGRFDRSKPAPPNSRVMLGVLPFDNRTGDPEQEHLAGGLTDEIITQLGRLDSARLGVIAGSSTRAYKENRKPIEQMARELGVDYVVEGGIQREMNRVRVTVRVIDVRDQAQIWVEDYDEDLLSMLDIQQEVAGLVSRSLELKLLQGHAPASARPETGDVTAYESYLKGRYFREQMTEYGFRKGLEYFQQAISQDSSYARAYAGLAGCYCLLGGHGMELERPHDVLPKAREVAQQALSLDDSLAEAHAALGMISLKYEWDLAEAERRFKIATDLNPSYAQAFLWYSLYHEVTGRTEQAITLATKARDLDPLSLGANVNLAQQYGRAGRHDEAIEQLGRAIELNPSAWVAHWVLGDAYEHKGMHREAVAALSKATLLSEANPAPMGSLGYIYARGGQDRLARGVMANLTDLREKRYVSPFNMAIVSMGLGEQDEAMEWLEQGYRERSRSMVWLNVDDRFDPMRGDPRFQDLLSRIGHSR